MCLDVLLEHQVILMTNCYQRIDSLGCSRGPAPENGNTSQKENFYESRNNRARISGGTVTYLDGLTSCSRTN